MPLTDQIPLLKIKTENRQCDAFHVDHVYQDLLHFYVFICLLSCKIHTSNRRSSEMNKRKQNTADPR